MGFPPPCQWVPRGPEDFPTQWLLMVLLTPTCHYLLIQCYKQPKTFWAKAHCCVSTKMMKRRHNLWFSVNCKCSGSSRSFCQIATSVYRYSSGQLRSSRWRGETFPRDDLDKCVCVNIQCSIWNFDFLSGQNMANMTVCVRGSSSLFWA